MSRLPIPDDWTEETDGYCFAWFCVPNSLQWRMIARGSIYQLTKGFRWDPDTGTITEAQAIARAMFESLCMATCEDIVIQIARIADAVEGIQIALNTDNAIYPDMSVADILQTGLIGRQFGITLPFEGEGLADIFDDRISELRAETETLHLRFRQDDYTGLSAEKNITETMEALLRSDTLFDYEIFTPNIVTVLQGLLSVGDSGIVTALKNLVASYVSKLGLPTAINDWLQDLLDTKEYLTVADMLLMLLQGFSASPGASDSMNYQIKAVAAAIRGLDVSTTVNLNNYNGCSCGDGETCEECTGQTVTVADEVDCGVAIG